MIFLERLDRGWWRLYEWCKYLYGYIKYDLSRFRRKNFRDGSDVAANAATWSPVEAYPMFFFVLSPYSNGFVSFSFSSDYPQHIGVLSASLERA